MTDVFVKFLAPPIATLIAALLVAVLKRQFSKLGIEIDEQEADALKRLTKDAIKAAEEASRRQPLTGADKLQITTALIAKDRPDLDLADVHQSIDSALPDVRAELKGTAQFPLSQAPAAARH